MESKICFKCNADKKLPEFYKHKGMADGYLGKCKECAKSDAKERFNNLSLDKDWVEKEKERGREKYYRLGYKDLYKQTPESKKRDMQKYFDKYPEKRKAHIFSNSLKPKIKGNHLHHWSYNEQHYKDVIELSPKDHAFLHRHIKYVQDAKIYKSIYGELLDTKLKHEDFLYSILNIEKYYA